MPESRNIASTVARIVAGGEEGALVSDVRIGLGYTAVMLDDNRAGVAYTFREEATGGCSPFKKLRPIVGRHSSELLTLLSSQYLIEVAVGLACANALVNVDDVRLRPGDILEHLELRSDDHVGMVGFFGPLVGILEKKVDSLTVFEDDRPPGEPVRPAGEAEEILPDCQVAIITATSIINRSIETLLEAAEGCREVVVLGASTPLLAEAFATRTVTWLSGVIVQEPREIMQIVSEGGGMRYFGPHIRKVSLRVNA
jgi:uncharacterized protein (DUF4213/DUF364 family)